MVVVVVVVVVVAAFELPHRANEMVMMHTTRKTDDRRVEKKQERE